VLVKTVIADRLDTVQVRVQPHLLPWWAVAELRDPDL
jgi:hypothetical protein